MNLYGWDLLFATKLSEINEKFQNNNNYLSSSFNFQSTDPFFKTTVSINGQFGKWSIAGKGSNSLINLTIPVNGFTISGMPADNISNGSFIITVGLNLNFISDKSNSNKQNLQFDYSDNGSNNQVDAINIVDINAPSLSQGQQAFAKQAIKECFAHNADKLNYVFASVILKNEQADWLSPDNISFDLVSLSGGDSYFCIFGSNGPKTGLSGQVDGSIFNATDNMYLGISAPVFLERIILPGIKRALPGSIPYFANPKIMMSSYTLPGTQVAAITYYPVILLMTMEIKGSQIVTHITGICDLKAGITMSFTYSSSSSVSIDTTKRTITVNPDPNPTFDHSLDMPWWAWLSIAFTGPIVIAITAIVSTIISNALADSIKTNSGAQVVMSTNSISWSNIDFQKINNGGILDNFYLTGTTN